MIKMKRFLKLPMHWKWIFAVFLFFVGTAGVMISIFPLELKELALRFQFWRSGIVHTAESGIESDILDRCSQTEKQSCSCVALISGLGEDSKSWKEILLWPEERWHQMGLLQPFKLVALGMPVAEGSDRSTYRVRKQAERLQPYLRSMCPRWTLVGHQMGGSVASWLALDWREGVHRLILLSSAGIRMERERNFSYLPTPSSEGIREFQGKAFYQSVPLSKYVEQEMIRKTKSSPALEVQKAQIAEDDLDLNLPTLHIPTLVLWGKEDQIIPMAMGFQMRNLVPGTIWREVSQCGHFIHKECPQAVAQSIVDMINFGRM
jgi:pimeloyl-ACP methyl ester carboxylesterase